MADYSTKHTQNYTLLRNSSKCEELIGVIFSVIGKELSLADFV